MIPHSSRPFGAHRRCARPARARFAALLLLCPLAPALTAQNLSLTYNHNGSLIDSAGPWSPNPSWFNGAASFAWNNTASPPDKAVFGWGFGAQGELVVSVPGTQRVRALTFNALSAGTSYTLSGGALDFVGNGIITMNNPAIVTSTLVGTASIAGTQLLTLGGTGDNAGVSLGLGTNGRLVLSKASSPTVHAINGSITLSNGSRLTLAGTGGDQFSATSRISQGDGATFDLNGRSETLESAGATNTINGGLTVTNNGPGASVLTLTGPNPSLLLRFQDGTGTLAVVRGSFFDVFALPSSHSGGTTVLSQPIVVAGSAPTPFGSGPLMIGPGGSVTFTEYMTVSVGGLGEAFGSGGTGTGTLAVANNFLIPLTIQPTSRDFKGVIANAFTLTIAASPTGAFQVLSGNNTYRGSTTVDGYLTISHPNALGSTLEGTTVNAGGILELYSQTSPASQTYAAEALILQDNATFQAHTGGTLRNPVFPGNIGLSGTPQVRVVGPNSGTLTLSGQLYGSGGLLVDITSGLIFLTGPDASYTGPTTIRSGTLDTRTNVVSQVFLGDGVSITPTARFIVTNRAHMSAPVTVPPVGPPAILEIGTVAAGVLLYNGALDINRATTLRLNFSPNDRATFLGGLHGSGPTLTIDGGGRAVFDSPANDFVGTIIVTGSGTILQAGLTISETIPDTANVQVDAGTLFRLAGPGDGRESINALSGAGQVERHPSVSGSHTLRLGSAGGSGTFSGVLADGNTASGWLLLLEKFGVGTQTLTGTSTFTGGTLVGGGVLEFGVGASLYGGGTVAATITVGDSGTLLFSRSDTFGGHTSSPNATLQVQTGGLVTNGARFNTLRNLALLGGELRASGGANPNFPAWQLKGTVTVGGSSLSHLTALVPTDALQLVQLGDNTAGGVTIFDVADVPAGSGLSVSARLGNGASPGGTPVAAGLTKTGAGTMQFLVAPTFTGPTTVLAGSLVVPGDTFTGTSGIALTPGATAAELYFYDTAANSLPLTASGAGLGTATIRANNFHGPVVALSGPVTLNRPTTFFLDQDNSVRLTFTGKITGSVGLLTIQGRTVLDNATNDFVGDIFVTAGTLLQAGLAQFECLPDTSNVTLGQGSVLLLSGPGGETIRSLRGTGGSVQTSSATARTLTLALPFGTEVFGGDLFDAPNARLALAKTGAGTQVLTGFNNPSTTSIATGGTLQIGQSGGGGVLYGSVANAGTLAFRRTDASQFSGRVSGAGTLLQDGAGATLTVSGLSTSTGLLSIVAGGVTLTGVWPGAFLIAPGARLTLSGGAVGTFGSLTEMLNQGVLEGTGTVLGKVRNQGTINAAGAGQRLAIRGGALTNPAGGIIRATSGAVIDLQGAMPFQNDGLIDQISGTVLLPATVTGSGIFLDSTLVRVKTAIRAGNTVSVTIDGYSGHTYQLQRSLALNSDVFTNLGATQTGSTGTELTFTDATASGSQGFYRVLVD